MPSARDAVATALQRIRAAAFEYPDALGLEDPEPFITAIAEARAALDGEPERLRGVLVEVLDDIGVQLTEYYGVTVPRTELAEIFAEHYTVGLAMAYGASDTDLREQLAERLAEALVGRDRWPNTAEEFDALRAGDRAARLGDRPEHLHLNRDVALAGARVAALEAEQPRLTALLRGAVVLGVGDVEVADGERGVDRLLDVAGLEQALAVDGVAPGAGEAVGLQLERLGGGARTREDAELLLQVVRVLVGEHVGHAEVAGGAAGAREAFEHAVPERGGEGLRDVDRVVGRAVEGGVCRPLRRRPCRRPRPGGTGTKLTRGSGRSLARSVSVQ